MISGGDACNGVGLFRGGNRIARFLLHRHQKKLAVPRFSLFLTPEVNVMKLFRKHFLELVKALALLSPVAG